MKKVALFTCLSVFALSIGSCSKDDDKSTSSNSVGGTVAFKYDTTQKTFSTSVVNQEAETGYPDYLTATASNGTATDLVSFGINEGSVGVDEANGFVFILAGDTFYVGNDFHSNVTDNTGTHLKGTFSGKVYLTTSGDEHTITNGTFDITYKAN